jgi:hypothetical protein
MRKTQILDNLDEHETDPEYLPKFKAASKNEQQIVDNINEIIRELRYEFYEINGDV